MKETLLLIGAAAIAFFAGRGIAKDLAEIAQAKRHDIEVEKLELEISKMKAAYLEGVKSCQNGEEWQVGWTEIQAELEKTER